MPKVPKPTSVTLFPLRRDLSIPPTRASIAFVAAAFVIPASLATLSMSSVLFIHSPPFDSRLAGDSPGGRTFGAAEKYHAYDPVSIRDAPKFTSRADPRRRDGETRTASGSSRAHRSVTSRPVEALHRAMRRSGPRLRTRLACRRWEGVD